MLFALLVFADFRLARFIALDTFPPMVRIRKRLTYRVVEETQFDANLWDVKKVLQHRGEWAELWTCPHCVGMWLALPLTALADLWYSVPAPVLVVFAVAGAQSFLASHVAGMEK